MKVYITADLEGVCGVTDWRETEYGGQGYEEACKQMSLEVAAACKGAMELGYEVVVKDGHSNALNIDPNLLPKGVQLIRGWQNTPLAMMAGLDETFDAVMYIGYHSAADTNTSPLKHTVEDYLYTYMLLNGENASEFSLNSVLGDEMGVPSVFFSGDLGACKDAEREYPGIVTVATKEGIGNGTWNLHPEDALDKIEDGVKEALKNLPKARALKDDYELTICYKDHGRAKSASWYPGAEQTDPYTVKFKGKTPMDIAIARSFIG